LTFIRPLLIFKGAHEIASGLGKSVRSVVAKLSREGVWVSGRGDRPAQADSNSTSNSGTKSAFIRGTESHKSAEAGDPKKSNSTKKPKKSSAKST
jgi:CTP:molybdopterin cytidylyltransferase MocA